MLSLGGVQQPKRWKCAQWFYIYNVLKFLNRFFNTKKCLPGRYVKKCFHNEKDIF